MANVDAPFGFRPIGGLDGSPYNGGTIRCVLVADAVATFVGDAVKLAGSASADGTAPSVVQVAANENIWGVITSFEADPANLSTIHRVASTLRYCRVAPALDNLFVIQCDGAFAITDVGETANIATVGTGSTVTGYSAMELDSSDITTGETLQILGVYPSPDNEVGANAKLIVRIFESALRGTGTIA